MNCEATRSELNRLFIINSSEGLSESASTHLKECGLCRVFRSQFDNIEKAYSKLTTVPPRNEVLSKIAHAPFSPHKFSNGAYAKIAIATISILLLVGLPTFWWVATRENPTHSSSSSHGEAKKESIEKLKNKEKENKLETKNEHTKNDKNTPHNQTEEEQHETENKTDHHTTSRSNLTSDPGRDEDKQKDNFEKITNKLSNQEVSGEIKNEKKDLETFSQSKNKNEQEETKNDDGNSVNFKNKDIETSHTDNFYQHQSSFHSRNSQPEENQNDSNQKDTTTSDKEHHLNAKENIDSHAAKNDNQNTNENETDNSETKIEENNTEHSERDKNAAQNSVQSHGSHNWENDDKNLKPEKAEWDDISLPPELTKSQMMEIEEGPLSSETSQECWTSLVAPENTLSSAMANWAATQNDSGLLPDTLSLYQEISVTKTNLSQFIPEINENNPNEMNHAEEFFSKKNTSIPLQVLSDHENDSKDDIWNKLGELRRDFAQEKPISNFIFPFKNTQSQTPSTSQPLPEWQRPPDHEINYCPASG